MKIYWARWAVAIQFRAGNQSNNLSKALNCKGNEHHMSALALAGMINPQLLNLTRLARCRQKSGTFLPSLET